MEPDELMMAFLHTKREKIKQDIRADKEYIETLDELKKILGKRLIVVSNKFDITNDAEAYETAKKIMESRGYYFNQDVFIEAFGECQAACVRLGKNVIEKAGGFERMEINRELTDAALNTKKRKPAN